MLVSDFDRTLYVNCDISAENIEAIRAWKKEGHLFVIATGRDERIIREKLLEYDLPADYLICNNGSRVVSGEGKCLLQQVISHEDAINLMKLLYEQYALPIDVVGVDRKVVFENEASLENGIPDKILQIHVRFPDHEKTVKAGKIINEQVKGITAFANESNLDIVKHGVDKAEGISCLLSETNWQGIPGVIGDSLNDLEMIRRFSGFTLDTANETVKAAAAASFPDVAHCIRYLTIP